jgi:hypothetical protein
MSIQQNFPSTRPSLNLNFARSQKLDPRITFTRTSSATRVNSDGLIEVVPANSPRFDFDPISGESLGLLVEEARSNLLLRSEELQDVYWSTDNGTLESSTAQTPRGDTFATKFVGNADTSWKRFFRFTPISAGNFYTASFFVKAAGIRYCSTYFRSSEFGDFNAGNMLVIDLETGDIAVGNTISGKVEKFPNGWFRISISKLATASSQTQCVVSLAESLALTFNPSILGDGTSGIYIWGAQLEEGAFPTSYIPTTTSTVTRTADNASITGSNFSDFYNPNEGTIYTVFRKSLGTQTNQYPFAISDNTVNNRFTLFTSGSSTLNFRLSSSGSSFNPSTLSFTAGEPIKASIASAVGTNQSIASSTGVLSTPGSPTSMPLVDRMYVGGAHSGLEKLNGTISQLIYYPSRLPNDQLITLTK